MRGRLLQRAHDDRRGSALVLSLAAIATVCAIGVGIVQLQVSLERRQSSASDRRRALYVAEAGIAEATLAISQGRSGAVGTEAIPAVLGNGVYWVVSEELVGGRYLLTSHAAAGTQRFSIQAMVLPNVSPVGEYGFFGDDGVSIGYGAVLDGYDSSTGSYQSQIDGSFPFPTTGEGVEIYSNGDIVLEDTPQVPPPPGPEGDGSSGGSGEAEDAGVDDGAIATPLWDSISTAGLDPNKEYALRMTVPHGQAPLDFGSNGLSYSMEFLFQNTGLSSSLFEAMYPGVTTAAYTDNGQVAISIREYIYLLQRTMNNSSVDEIERTYAAASNPVQESEVLDGMARASAGDDVMAAGSSDDGGPPPPPPTGPSGGGTYVFGEAVPGEDAFVSTSGDAFVSELAESQKEDLVMPGVVVPSNLETESGTRVIGDAVLETITAQDIWIDGIQVDAGGTLVLEGPVTLAVSTFDLATQGTLIFDDSAGPIRLYATDRLNFASGSLLSSRTPHEDALGTHVFVGGDSSTIPGHRVTIDSGGEFHGVLYAPEDEVILPNTLRFFGAAAAKYLMIQDYASASYDRSFATNGIGVPSLPKILSWQVVQIEEGEIKSLRFNPVMALRARGITPTPSSQAALETDFEVTYLDAGGSLRSYSGSSAAFDWSNVGRLTSMRWVSAASGQPMQWGVPSGYDPDLLVSSFRADERQRVYGTAVLPHPAGVDVEIPSRVNADRIDSGPTVSLPPVRFQVASAVATSTAPSFSASAADGTAFASASAEGGSDSASDVGGSGSPPNPAPVETAPTTGFDAAPIISKADVDSMSLIDKAVSAINGNALDYNGDGTAIAYPMEVVGSTLKVTNPNPTDADSLADLAALGADFDLQPDGAGGFTADLGGLAPVLQYFIDNGVPTYPF